MISESLAPGSPKRQYCKEPGLALSLVSIVSFTEKNRQQAGRSREDTTYPATPTAVLARTRKTRTVLIVTYPLLRPEI